MFVEWNGQELKQRLHRVQKLRKRLGGFLPAIRDAGHQPIVVLWRQKLTFDGGHKTLPIVERVEPRAIPPTRTACEQMHDRIEQIGIVNTLGPLQHFELGEKIIKMQPLSVTAERHTPLVNRDGLPSRIRGRASVACVSPITVGRTRIPPVGLRAVGGCDISRGLLLHRAFSLDLWLEIGFPEIITTPTAKKNRQTRRVVEP